MAKQKIDTAQGEGADTFQSDDSAIGKVETPEPKQETVPAPQKGQEKPLAEQPDSFTLDILKSQPKYESLYIDRHGGTFTADTPKSIRGSAKLYKNPYYKA